MQIVSYLEKAPKLIFNVANGEMRAILFHVFSVDLLSLLLDLLFFLPRLLVFSLLHVLLFCGRDGAQLLPGHLEAGKRVAQLAQVLGATSVLSGHATRLQLSHYLKSSFRPIIDID
jgi:hypothetical protein